MNHYQFNSIPSDQRAEYVWKQGTFLTFRYYLGCTVALYYIPGFFAEVWYSPEDNQIALVHGFDDKGLLEPYLEMIELKHLL
jgi:hypothetical protein